MAYERTRKEWKGNAVQTKLSVAITAGDTTFQLLDGSGLPTGASYPFIISVDRGKATEEKVLVTSRSTNTLTILQRGFDSTTAQTHPISATVDHVMDANTIDAANDWAAMALECKLARAAAIAIGVAPTVITWDTETADVSGFIVAPSTTLTVPAGGTGTYLVTVFETFASVVAGTAALAYNLNGAAGWVNASYTRGGDPSLVYGFTLILPLIAGDTLQFRASQSFGGSINMTATLNVSRIQD